MHICLSGVHAYLVEMKFYPIFALIIYKKKIGQLYRVLLAHIEPINF